MFECAAEGRCCTYIRGTWPLLNRGMVDRLPDARLLSWLTGEGQDGDGSEATQTALQGLRAYPKGIGAEIPGEHAQSAKRGHAGSTADGSWGAGHSVETIYSTS